MTSNKTGFGEPLPLTLCWPKKPRNATIVWDTFMPISATYWRLGGLEERDLTLYYLGYFAW